MSVEGNVLMWILDDGSLVYAASATSNREWPESFCTMLSTLVCHEPIPSNFTISSFKPMYSPDREVPPYADNDDCSSLNPADSAFITEASLVEAGIKDDMVKYWPNLLNPDGIEFWQLRWEKHGRCFDYDDEDRFHYFKVVIDLALQIDLLEILRRAKPTIRPGSSGKKLSGIARAVSDHFHVKVEIHCNRDAAQNLYQLNRITICIKNDATYMDCPGRYHYCPPDRGSEINFPKP